MVSNSRESAKGYAPSAAQSNDMAMAYCAGQEFMNPRCLAELPPAPMHRHSQRRIMKPLILALLAALVPPWRMRRSPSPSPGVSSKQAAPRPMAAAKIFACLPSTPRSVCRTSQAVAVISSPLILALLPRADTGFFFEWGGRLAPDQGNLAPLAAAGPTIATCGSRSPRRISNYPLISPGSRRCSATTSRSDRPAG